jgi:cytidylate kinase
MAKQTREKPSLAQFIERQAQAWALGQEIAERTQPKRFDQPHRMVGSYITISREAGVPGGEIAQLVGRKLGWEVLDKSLVECAAARFRVSPSAVELVDETTANWAHDLLGVWLDPKLVPHEKFVAFLSRVILSAARRGNVVIVGRGANFLLPRNQGLAVRIIASEKHRLQHVMQAHGMSEAQARQYLADVEHGRREFVQRFFRHDIADPHWYDVVMSVDRLSPEAAADEIVAMYQRRNRDSRG